jgi:carboxyl-terminal processing protease
MNLENKKLIYILNGLPVVILTLFIGIYIGQKQTNEQAITPDGNYEEIALSPEFQSFWKVWKTLDDKFVRPASTTNEKKIYGAIQGLAESYGDPYTVFFPPVESKMFKEEIAGDFGGVGMEIGIKDKQLQVVSPIKDSPADRAGVRSGDLIISINSTSTAGMSTDEAVKLIRGPKGTEVKITFIPAGTTKPVIKTIIRDTIKIPTIDYAVKDGGISVISLYSFTAQSPELFRGALRKFVTSGNHKLILDLRRNPGGYLDAAWDIASWFLPAGKVIVTEDFGAKSSPNVFRSKGYNIFNSNLQMIILVDGGSASASEILAGALQEHGIAKLVGTKTFGKGSVQELVNITDDTSLKVTVASWLTPRGHNLSHDGLEPDFEVKISEKDQSTKIDPQMEKAIQLLTAKP